MTDKTDKGPRFLLAENPQADELQGTFHLYIFHNREPHYLAQVFDEEDGGTDIRVIKLFTNDEPDAAKMAKLMRDMGEWYRNYMDWEEAQDQG